MSLDIEVDNVYNKESEGGMRYDDPTCNVDWGSLLNGIEPVLSRKKDQIGPTLEESNNQYVYRRRNKRMKNFNG